MAAKLTAAAAIALDLGTTAIKAGLLDQHGKLHHIVTQPAPEISSHQGRFESDALAYAKVTEQTLSLCLKHTNTLPPLGLCSQRSSFLLWKRTNGDPVTPLISWQDNRGLTSCNALTASKNTIRQLTGLQITPYYFAPKLSVLLQAHPEWRQQLEQGDLMVGTLDSFLIWRWSNGKHHVTDASMAARTLLMENQQQWSTDLCRLFNIPKTALPQIKPSTQLNLVLNNGLTLQASVGDQSAAFIAGIDKKETTALVNLGTGGFVMRYLSKQQNIPDGYLQTLIYQDNTGRSHTAIEGTLNSIARALAPYPVNDCQISELATNDIFCLAEPSGLGAPYFRCDIGIEFSQSTDHLTTRQIGALLLEGIIFRVVRILEDFHHQSPITYVYLSGGLSKLTCLQQGIAQCVPYKLSSLQQQETSLQGAALLATGLTIKLDKKIKEIRIPFKHGALVIKYQQWKHWLDNLLKNKINL